MRNISLFQKPQPNTTAELADLSGKSNVTLFRKPGSNTTPIVNNLDGDDKFEEILNAFLAAGHDAEAVDAMPLKNFISRPSLVSTQSSSAMFSRKLSSADNTMENKVPQQSI